MPILSYILVLHNRSSIFFFFTKGKENATNKEERSFPNWQERKNFYKSNKRYTKKKY